MITCINCRWWYEEGETKQGDGQCTMFAHNYGYARKEHTYVLPLSYYPLKFPVVYTEGDFGCRLGEEKEENPLPSVSFF